jgi:diguanylate cyclase (GGDEF)-like protein
LPSASSNVALLGVVRTSTNGVAAGASLAARSRRGRFGRPSWRRSHFQYVSVRGFTPISAPNSAALSPLSRHRSTRFAHSALPTRARPSSLMPPELRRQDARVRNARDRTDTVHLPRWQRGDSSFELLLGLRDPAVDTQLRELVPLLSAETQDECGLGAGSLIEALDDPSIRRLVHVVSRTASALSLAWVTPTADEVHALISDLPVPLRQRRDSVGVPPVVFASLCDLCRRWGRAASLSLLKQPRPERWLERVALAAARSLPFPAPALIEPLTPAWLLDLSPALIRDPLTGLLSRSVLSENPHRFRLPEGQHIVTLPSSQLILLDVDRMKQILDVYGMPSGDGVLVAIGEHLQALFGDRVIRYGGDEFLVVWEHDDVERVARIAVESIRALSVTTLESPAVRIAVTVSAGVGTDLDPMAALRAADDALGRAKLSGRDRVE